ncbi:Protein kinase-like domain [Penicillium roqueforti FM164]|uniref:Protein kinase-like domain n=1 Tax=Penicillium roqueforti (strain FM164) TaxID=1365484 RepID=W6PYI9_PENRF|nr:Protein kinase-like domain [Penicillium roqueforti FM164]
MKRDQDKRATRFDMLQAQAHFSSSVTAAETQPHNFTDQPGHTQSSIKYQKGPAAQQDRSRKILRGSPKTLELPTIVDTGGLAQTPLIRTCSPWETYKPIFTCDLAGTVSICEHRRRGSKVVAIRSSSRTDGEESLHKYTRFDHFNIISASECFKDNGVNHFIVDDLPISLEHLVASDAYPSEVQLASIVKQVMDGLSYLIECGYEHSSLKCSTTLMSLDGVVKIELTVPYTPEQSQSLSLKGLGSLTMELMQKYVKENVGIDDPARWPIDSNAVDFLSSTTSARSVMELTQHPLVAATCSTGSLVGLARLAIVSACTFYSYKE